MSQQLQRNAPQPARVRPRRSVRDGFSNEDERARSAKARRDPRAPPHTPNTLVVGKNATPLAPPATSSKDIARWDIAMDIARSLAHRAWVVLEYVRHTRKRGDRLEASYERRNASIFESPQTFLRV